MDQVYTRMLVAIICMTEKILTYDHFPLGLINSDLVAVRDDLVDLYAQTKVADRWKVTTGALDLNKIATPPDMQSGGAHLPKFVIWELSGPSKWTAFFSNYLDGLNTTKLNLAKRFGRRVVDVHFSNKDFAVYPAYSFKYYDGADKQRIVYSMKDGRSWTFYQQGDPLDFENLDYYQNRVKNKRMNNGIILEYLADVGISLDEQAFQPTIDSIYFERTAW